MYGELIKGKQSSGDNLLGFVLDMEAYLEESDYFTSVVVDSASESESLINARCQYSNSIEKNQIITELKDIWESYLRYQEFEKHSVEIDGDNVVFHFCTTSGGLGVTGKITAKAT